jgi:phosphohistidine phosphatase
MSETTNRMLVLLRHAKSDWPAGVPDHERPLADRGRRAAPAIGRWLREAGFLPDHVVCSTALRTRQTWELVRGELDADPPAEFESRVYGATVRELLDVVGDAPAGAGTVLLVGHNPGVQSLALLLAGDAPGDDRDRMHDKFPTAAIAAFELSGGWDRVAAGPARLARFVRPRDL